jgi:L-lysine exporter family protein LysE/ArgO
MILAAATGFLTSLSLLLAFGAQSTFVLQQGLRRRHVFLLSLLCAVSDATLIIIGVATASWLVALNPGFPAALALGGAAFLFFYGGLRFRAAWRGHNPLTDGTAGDSLRNVLLTGLALTWLSPHVFLDTVGVIGPLSTRFAGFDKLAFTLGSVSASFLFFFILGYGARLLAPLMRTPAMWRVFDSVVGLIMWVIAASLLAGVF